MKLQMHSIHFDADKKLIDFIQRKTDKLDTFYGRIIDGEVTMRLNKDETQENKLVELKVRIPGQQLFSREQAKTWCSPHTLTSYETDLQQFQKFLTASYEVSSPETASFPMIRSWIVSLVEEKKNATSINRKIATLRTYYKFLLKKNVLSSDPMLKVKSLKLSKPLPQFVDENSLNGLLDTFEFPTPLLAAATVCDGVALWHWHTSVGNDRVAGERH
jgi:hypothetical protein